MKFNHILVTTDFSPDSANAFEYAAHLTNISEAQLTVLHILENWEIPVLLQKEITHPEALDQFKEQLQQDALNKVQTLAESIIKGVPYICKVELCFNTPSSEICNFAKTNQVDLIIISDRGKGALKSFFIGSTVQKVTNLAHCPTLVIPKKKGVQYG